MSVTVCSKPFDVICPSYLVDSCRELQDIFHCNDKPRCFVRIVKVDPTQNGYFCQFEEPPRKPQTDELMNEPDQTFGASQEELNVMGPLRVQSSSTNSNDEIETIVAATGALTVPVVNETDFVSSAVR